MRDNRISLPLDIPNVRVLKTEIDDEGDFIITVESTLEETICQKCGRTISSLYGHDKEITLRHLPIWGRQVYIRLQPKRFQYSDCDGAPTRTQQLAWYDRKSPHPRAYEKHLLLLLINSTIEDVSQKIGAMMPLKAVFGDALPLKETGHKSSALKCWGLVKFLDQPTHRAKSSLIFTLELLQVLDTHWCLD